MQKNISRYFLLTSQRSLDYPVENNLAVMLFTSLAPHIRGDCIFDAVL